jgi:hypothetical protein
VEAWGTKESSNDHRSENRFDLFSFFSLSIDMVMIVETPKSALDGKGVGTIAAASTGAKLCSSSSAFWLVSGVRSAH